MTASGAAAEEASTGDGPMRVFVAIDGSESAGQAVELVSNLAWPVGTEILVAEAVESGAGLFGGPWPALPLVSADDLEAELRAGAGRTLEEAHGRLARPGLAVATVILQGRAATVIPDHARGVGADLIVVGSRGHGTIESMLLGSVSAEVIDHAAVPVLVARGPRADRLVLAWDGSPCASRAAALVRRWPAFTGSSIRVVSVADIQVPWWTGFPEPGSPEMMPTYVSSADASRLHHDQLATDMAADLRSAGLDAEADRCDGDAAAGILAAARASDADLIVMGTRGRTGLTRLVLGSVARNVLQHATCSVLVVHDCATDTATG